MPDSVEIYGQFGQTLAVAEATLKKVLESHLATAGTTPDRWYALKLTAQAEPIARAAVVEGLAAGGKVQPVDAEPLLGALEADGLLEGGDVVSLTESGRSYFAELRQFVITPTIRLLGRFELADVETTIRTLRDITARAREEDLESPAIQSGCAIHPQGASDDDQSSVASPDRPIQPDRLAATAARPDTAADGSAAKATAGQQ